MSDFLTGAPALERFGFRFGDRATRTSRTIMFRELQGLLAAAPAGATLADYRALVIADNALGKRTGATRRLTFQRLSELYALNPRSPLFRVLRSLWQACPDGCPILALFCALARDPLLRMTAPVILESAST